MSDSNLKQQNYTQSSDFSNKFLYFAAGGAIGAGLTLLFAPKSGAELRQDIADVTKKGYDETLEYAHSLKDQSVSIYNTLKEKTENANDLAASKWLSAENEGKDISRSISKSIETELNDEKAELPKKENVGRRSSNTV